MAIRPSVAVRLASGTDIFAILCLLLTSFRQFPLFSTLYSPLQDDINNARDTLYFWRRRLILDLLDTSCDVIVAEVPKSELQRSEGDLTGEDNKRSTAMLAWLRQHFPQDIEPAGAKTSIAGFAIWRCRGQAFEERQVRPGLIPWLEGKLSSCSKLEIETNAKSDADKWTQFVLTFWKSIYTRKDIDPAKYKAYLEAEEVLSEQFVSHSPWHLSTYSQWGLDSTRTPVTNWTI